ncbi:hypothetical protein DUI87_09141 [Hirundo rustica rustica]|uniref:Uncharacterized protein n=1 Tax=Hirundo rustica rustica TaxID=333673 RepID=A0A3M0KRR6_HIRRU|nr:hypothetical protein DUI87_09141 [Hirundo rustica rustica]
MCQVGGLYPEDLLRQNPMNKCEQCLKGQFATKVITYQAQYNCQLEIPDNGRVKPKLTAKRNGQTRDVPSIKEEPSASSGLTHDTSLEEEDPEVSLSASQCRLLGAPFKCLILPFGAKWPEKENT